MVPDNFLRLGIDLGVNREKDFSDKKEVERMVDVY
jgi:hypothetical protein